jgi:hypothetical protein
MTDLSPEALQELEAIIKEIEEIANDVVKDYEDTPSEESGSVIEIHINSPLLEENEQEL